MKRFNLHSFLFVLIPFLCFVVLNNIYAHEVSTTEQVFSIQEERTFVTEKQEELKGNKEINVPLDLEMIGVKVEKQGIYTIILGFDPGDIPLPEFREHMKREFTGTIEVLSNTEHYTTIKYEDFIDFAMSPQGGGYGPVYSFIFNFSTPEGILRFYPKIKSKKQYVCSFAVTRQLDSLNYSNKKIMSSFLSNKEMTNGINKNNLEIPVQIDRIDIFLEASISYYCVSIGFHKDESSDIADFRGTLLQNYCGNIEILKEGNQHSYISYHDSVNVSLFESFTGFQYGFRYMGPGWYTFKPKIFSIQERTFGLEIEPSYPGKK